MLDDRIINKVECDLCGMPFDKRDKDYEVRIIRHNDYHNPKFKGKSREHNGKYVVYKGDRNVTMGIPKYIEVK